MSMENIRQISPIAPIAPISACNYTQFGRRVRQHE